MIPTAIFLGLIGGLIPRYRWWSIPVIGVIWSIMLGIGDDRMTSLRSRIESANPGKTLIKVR